MQHKQQKPKEKQQKHSKYYKDLKEDNNMQQKITKSEEKQY